MIAAGAVIGVLLLVALAAMLYVGLPYTQPPKRSCCCGMYDLGTAHWYATPDRIHEPDRCGPYAEWLPRG